MSLATNNDTACTCNSSWSALDSGAWSADDDNGSRSSNCVAFRASSLSLSSSENDLHHHTLQHVLHRNDHDHDSSMPQQQRLTSERAWLDARGAAAAKIPTHRVVSTLGLVALLYFVCCGGPVGSEPVMSAGGPLRGLVAQVAFPLLLNGPITLALVELATAYANDGGYAVWVLHAFGSVWGFQVGFWSWAASLVDRVVYVHFLFEQLAAPLGYTIDSEDDSNAYYVSPGSAYAMKAAAAVLLMLPTLCCTKTFVRALLVQLVLVLVPLLVLTIWGFVVTPPSVAVFQETALPTDSDWTVDWCELLDVFWFYDGFYLAAVFGGEVARPHRTYPRGLQIGFLMTWLSYLLPMLAVVGASSVVLSTTDARAFNVDHGTTTLHWSLYAEDSYPLIARAIGGSVLHIISLIGLVAGVTGMYMAELFCQAYQLKGMAENGLLPSLFTHRSRRSGSPRTSIYINTAAVLLLLAVVDSASYSIYKFSAAKDALAALIELFIIASLFRLRQTQPFVYRPFKIPGGVCGMSMLLVLPVAMLCYNVGRPFWALDTAGPLGGILIVGVVLCGAQLAYRHWQHETHSRAVAAADLMTMTPTMDMHMDDMHASTSSDDALEAESRSDSSVYTQGSVDAFDRFVLAPPRKKWRHPYERNDGDSDDYSGSASTSDGA